ncbi:MAG: hypothetical protein ACLVJH_10065 [Faecalibacterium prausnitzii]
MRNRLERRRLTLRAAALCIVLVLLCGCLLPALPKGRSRTDSVPDTDMGRGNRGRACLGRRRGHPDRRAGASARGRRQPRRGGRAG